jgi:hypothetical protein
MRVQNARQWLKSSTPKLPTIPTDKSSDHRARERRREPRDSKEVKVCPWTKEEIDAAITEVAGDPDKFSYDWAGTKFEDATAAMCALRDALLAALPPVPDMTTEGLDDEPCEHLESKGAGVMGGCSCDECSTPFTYCPLCGVKL